MSFFDSLTWRYGKYVCRPSVTHLPKTLLIDAINRFDSGDWGSVSDNIKELNEMMLADGVEAYLGRYPTKYGTIVIFGEYDSDDNVENYVTFSEEVE